MFERIAILTTLGLTAVSAVYADPWPRERVDADIYIRADRDYERRYERDRYDRRDRYGRDRDHRGWLPLATRMRGRTDLQLDGRHAPMQSLMIRGHRGIATIGSVLVEYAGYDRQVIPVSKQLERGDTITMRLDQQAPIHRITIYVSGGNGSYSVFGN